MYGIQYSDDDNGRDCFYKYSYLVFHILNHIYYQKLNLDKNKNKLIINQK